LLRRPLQPLPDLRHRLTGRQHLHAFSKTQYLPLQLEVKHDVDADDDALRVIAKQRLRMMQRLGQDIGRILPVHEQDHLVGPVLLRPRHADQLFIVPVEGDSSIFDELLFRQPLNGDS